MADLTLEPKLDRGRSRRRRSAGVAVAMAIAVAGPLAACRPGPASAPSHPAASATQSPEGSPGSGVAGPAAGTCLTPPPAAGRSPTPVTSDKPRPKPSEACASAAGRLNAALSDQLGGALPGAGLANGVDAGRKGEWFYFENGTYFAQVRVSTGGKGVGEVGIKVSTWSVPPTERCPAGLPKGWICQTHRRPDGTTVFRQTYSVAGAGDKQHSVVLGRPDHTVVVLAAFNYQPNRDNPKDVRPVLAPEPPLTAEQLETVGSDPRLTLFP